MIRNYCPVCEEKTFTLPRPDLQPHPYVECTKCGFYYQKELIPKKYEAYNEPSGDTMSLHDKEVNQRLAEWLDNKFLSIKDLPPSGTVDLSVVSKFESSLNESFKDIRKVNCLDIGSKFPWLSHCLGNLGWGAYAIDGIPEILKFTKEHKLNVHSYQCDFEKHTDKWPWDSENDLEPLIRTLEPSKQKFDLISLVHVIEHFYHPIETLQKIFDLLVPNGILFVRCPDSETPGIEQHFSKGHYEIHPQVWNERSLRLAARKVGFNVVETYSFAGGQRDMVLKKDLVYGKIKEHEQELRDPSNPLNALLNNMEKQELEHKAGLIGAGLIVKNEQEDLPECLDSIKNVADLIYIVDTGSTDNTMQVIRDWVVTNKWQGFFDGARPEKPEPKTVLLRTYLNASKQNDKGEWELWNFAQARNQFVEALDKLVGWCWWLDADDVVLEPEKVKALTTQPYDIFSFGIVNAKTNWTQRFIHHRLWRTGMGVRFQGAVHEYPQWSPRVRVKDTDLNIQHRWTQHVTQEGGVTRNLRILCNEYKEGHRDNRTLFYYANSLREAGQWEEAVKIYREYLNNPVSYHDERMFCFLYKMRAERQIAYKTGDYGAFFSTLFEALSRDQRFSEISMEGAYAFFDLGKWDKAIGMCHLAMQTIPPSGMFLEYDKYKDQPHRILARCYKKLNNVAQAIYHTEKVLEFVPNDIDMQDQLKDWSSTRVETYRPSPELRELHLNRPGAAGDIIASLTAVTEYKRRHSGTKIIYYCAPQYVELVKLCRCVNEVRTTEDLKTLRCLAQNLIGYPLNEGYPNVPMKKHLIDYFCEELGEERPSECWEPKFSQIILVPLPYSYICIHTTAGWSPYKNWAIERWQQIVDKLRKTYPSLDIVQIGAETDKKLSDVMDLTGKLSLVESIFMIKHAKLHLGVDSFSNHVTALYPETPAVILWGSTSPIGSGYEHNTNIWKGCGKAGDFNKGESPCYREYQGMCVTPRSPEFCPNIVNPYLADSPEGKKLLWDNPEHPCMMSITVNEVWNAIVEKLKCLK